MSRLLTLLDTALSNDIKLNKSPYITIEENNPKARNKCVKFNSSSKTVAFTLEGINHKKFFTDTEGLKSVNDGTIVVEKEGKVFVLLIELKSNNISKAYKQLISAKIDFEFILKVIQIFNSDIISKDLLNSIEYRGIVFTTKSGVKSRKVKHDRAAKYELVGDMEITTAEGNCIHHLSGFIV